MRATVGPNRGDESSFITTVDFHGNELDTRRVTIPNEVSRIDTSAPDDGALFIVGRTFAGQSLSPQLARAHRSLSWQAQKRSRPHTEPRHVRKPPTASR